MRLRGGGCGPSRPAHDEDEEALRKSIFASIAEGPSESRPASPLNAGLAELTALPGVAKLPSPLAGTFVERRGSVEKLGTLAAVPEDGPAPAFGAVPELNLTGNFVQRRAPVCGTINLGGDQGASLLGPSRLPAPAGATLDGATTNRAEAAPKGSRRRSLDFAMDMEATRERMPGWRTARGQGARASRASREASRSNARKKDEEAFKYEGERNAAGEREGRGTSTFPDGSTYEGAYKSDQQEGQGTYKCVSGANYEGEWRAGMSEGRGTYTTADGDKYEGEFKANYRDGWGTYTFANGHVYDGEYKADKKHGWGTDHYPGGDHYEGAAR